MGPVLISIPMYLNTTVVPTLYNVGSDPGQNITIYVVNLSELAQAGNMWLYRFNLLLYLIILKIVPSIVLTVLTGALIQAMYKAEERSAR